MDKSIENILDKLPPKVKEIYLDNIGRNITEIRIRAGFDIKICIDGRYITIKNTSLPSEALEKLFLSFCENTLSAYEDQIANGFITLPGGHRTGITGTFNKDIYGNTILTKIQALNIRLSHFNSWHIDDDVCAFNKGLLIAGRPHSGKTTFIRNMCSRLQDFNVVVCDERNELYYPDLNNDFIINLPKSTAISQATRTMNPHIIICDEIGSEKEAGEILSGVNSGVRFVCTVHSDDIDSLQNKPNIAVLLNAGVFDKIILLDCKNNDFYIKEKRNV